MNEFFLLGVFGVLGVAAIGPVLAAVYLAVVLSRRKGADPPA